MYWLYISQSFAPCQLVMSSIRCSNLPNEDRILQVPPRRLIHPHTVLFEPNPIDLWLIANKCDGWHREAYLLDPPVFSNGDKVLCIVVLDVAQVSSNLIGFLSHVSMQTRNGFMEMSDTYTLYLTAVAPVSSGLPLNMLISPRSIFGRYEGYCFDSDAPLWTGMQSGVPLRFLQPRGAMAELFHGLAIWAENLSIVCYAHHSMA